MFRNLDKLSKWVLGIYAPQDFQASARPDDAIARRKRLREDLLCRLVTEEDGTFVQTSKWEVHPLEVVLKSKQILEILQKTTAEAALGTTNRQHPDLTADGEDNEPQQQEKGKKRRIWKMWPNNNTEIGGSARIKIETAMDSQHRQERCYVPWRQMVRNFVFHGKPEHRRLPGEA